MVLVPIRITIVVLLGTLYGLPVSASSLRDFGPHHGYISSTAGERSEVVEDMVVVLPPAPSGPPLHERIFNEKLSREFTERYEAKFGHTEELRVWNSPNRLTYYDDLFGFRGSAQENNNEKRRFGEFMLRRLTEYHVESYAKSDPDTRRVWEMKERLSQMKVQMGKKVNFSAKYSLSANTADINILNPWVQSKVSLQFGDSRIQETILSLAKNVTSTVLVETHYHTMDGVVSLIGRKSLESGVGLSMTTSTFTHHHGKTKRESLYLAGASYSF